MNMLPDFKGQSQSWKRRAALIDAGSELSISYRELAESIGGFGALLDKKDVREGDCVSILARSSFHTCMAALAFLGKGRTGQSPEPRLSGELLSGIIHRGPAASVSSAQPGPISYPVRAPQPA